MSGINVVKGTASVSERKVAANRYSKDEIKRMLREIGGRPSNSMRKSRLVNLWVESGADIPIKQSTIKQHTHTHIGEHDEENIAAIGSDEESEQEEEKELKYNGKRDIDKSNKIRTDGIDSGELRSMLVEVVKQQLPTLIASTNQGKSIHSISNVPIASNIDNDSEAVRTHIDMTRAILHTPVKSTNTVRFDSNTHSTQVRNNIDVKGSKLKKNKGDRGTILRGLATQIGEVDNKSIGGNSDIDDGFESGIDTGDDSDGAVDGDVYNVSNNMNHERESSTLQHKRLATSIISECLQTCGTVQKWVERYQWKEKRKYYECIALAQAIDAFLRAGITEKEEGMEILARRLAGMQLADQTGKWEMVKALDRSTHTLLNHQQLHLVDKVASVFKKLQPVKYDNSNTGYQRDGYQRGKSNGGRGRGGRGYGYNKGGYNNNNNNSNADKAAGQSGGSTNNSSTAPQRQ